GLMLISAGGFVITALLVKLLAHERDKLVATSGSEAQRTTINHRLGGGNPLDGFILLLKSPYLMLIAGFLFLMTSISTIVYTQLGDLITKAFKDHNARTQAYALIELAVNSLAVLIQLVGTGRIIKRFGVTVGLLLNPIIMVFAFLAIAFSPILIILGSLQVVRRVAEYAVAKPTREMLFTVVDQESKYKAKNVIDTVVYRGGDLVASFVSVGVLNGFGDIGLAILGIGVSLIWFPIAWVLGRRYESARSAEGVTAEPVTAGH
ncbi:MAG TPA: Npt1/Npt2 family nucleotide transporter, partial [Steroidobacteraceae bacterium]